MDKTSFNSFARKPPAITRWLNGAYPFAGSVYRPEIKVVRCPTENESTNAMPSMQTDNESVGKETARKMRAANKRYISQPGLSRPPFVIDVVAGDLRHILQLAPCMDE